MPLSVAGLPTSHSTHRPFYLAHFASEFRMLRWQVTRLQLVATDHAEQSSHADTRNVLTALAGQLHEVSFLLQQLIAPDIAVTIAEEESAFARHMARYTRRARTGVTVVQEETAFAHRLAPYTPDIRKETVCPV